MIQPFLQHLRDGTPVELILKEVYRLQSPMGREAVVKVISQHKKIPVQTVRSELNNLKDDAPQNDSAGPYTAKFDGLVDIVIKDGKPMFLVIENNKPKLKEKVVLDDTIHYPPPLEQFPFKLIPDADKVLEYYIKDSDIELYVDLCSYHKDISELPCATHYDLLAACDFLTYLQEKIQYSPYLWLYAIPERGKSRTGKGCIYVSYRGVHVESLRDPYLIRLASNWGATVFFDVTELSKKAERAGSEDILLVRFEKGAIVPRVLYPDRGPYLDTVMFEVFGPTIIATNEPVNQILGTRAIMIPMPESTRTYEEEVTPEKSLPLKERLVAFRARNLSVKLPNVEKPARGRLGDILKPVFQILRLIIPEREEDLLKLVEQIHTERKESQSETYEGRLLTSIYSLRDGVEGGLISIKQITDCFNESVKERFHTTTQKVGWKLSSLGFQKRRRNDGVYMEWDDKLLKNLLERFGLNELYEPDDQNIHNLHNQHPSNHDRASNGADSGEGSTSNLHANIGDIQRCGEDCEESEAFSQGSFKEYSDDGFYDDEPALLGKSKHSETCECDDCINME